MRTVGGSGREEPLEFWKASDDRFIIKTLVNAWNVADLCAAAVLFYFP
jgi:hypothetical protein